MARVSWGYVVMVLLRKKKSHPSLEMGGGQITEGFGFSHRIMNSSGSGEQQTEMRQSTCLNNIKCVQMS